MFHAAGKVAHNPWAPLARGPCPQVFVFGVLEEFVANDTAGQPSLTGTLS